MRKNRAKKNKASKFWIRFFLIVVLLAFIITGYSIFQEVYQRYQLNKEYAALQAEIQKYEQKNQKQKGLNKYFETSLFSEKEAREKLNVKREGENVVYLKPVKEEENDLEENDLETSQEPGLPNEENSDNLNQEEQAAQNLPNPKKWWNYFFKK
jgi:cell division protein FtsB